MRTLSILLAVTVGCGDDAAQTPDGGTPDDAMTNPGDWEERSGSRLKRRGYDFEGAQAFDQIYDADRGETCAIAPWSDGKSYCTPLDNTRQVAFADAACTIKRGMGYLDTACPASPPSYFVEHAPSGCGSAGFMHLYAAGPVVAATEYYSATPGGGCEGPHPLAPYYQFYELGPEVPTTELVAISTSEPVGDHRLQQLFHESADGLRVAGRVRDRELEVECTPSVDRNSASGTCYPGSTTGAGGFSDAACSAPMATDQRSCAPARFALEYDRPLCRNPTYSVFRLGPELATTVGYRVEGGACTAFDLGADSRAYALGAEVEPATVSRGTVAGARVHRSRVTLDGDTFLSYGFYDATQQADCYLMTAADGQVRCLPNATTVQRLYRDAACTDAVDAVRDYQGAPTCAPVPAPRFASSYVDPAEPCAPLRQMHDVGPEITGPLYQMYSTCEEVSRENAKFFAPGAVIPPAEFAAAVPYTEP